MDPRIQAVLSAIAGLDMKIQAALIAAGVTILGYFFTRWRTNAELKSKLNELRQAQLKDILAKRIEVYPELWRIGQTQLSDLERKETIDNDKWAPNADWARNLLERLMDWHQEYGVFLSQDSYAAFAKLRNETKDLVLTSKGRQPTREEFQKLDRIYYHGYQDENDKSRLPLATCLKNDLGSYASIVIAQPTSR